MKVKFLMSLCGGLIAYHAGDMAEIENSEALSLIDANIAEAVNKKDYESAKKQVEEAEQIKNEKMMQIARIALKEELESEKAKLLERIAEIDNILIEENE